MSGRDSLRFVVLCWGTFLLCGFTWNPFQRKVEEGNRLFDQGKYEEALGRYSEAQGERPESSEVFFNMGDSFYRQKKYNEALEAHAQSVLRSRKTRRDLQAKGFYNMGNSLVRQGNLEKALAAYKKAIDLDQTDIDTKYNIEFVQKKLNEQSQEKQDQKKKPQNQDEQKKEDKGGQGGGASQQQKQEEQEKPDKSPEEQKKQPEPSDEKQETGKSGEISKEDAERLLGALQGEERNLSMTLEKGKEPIEELPPEKDW